MKLRSTETPDEPFLRVLHDIMVSDFKLGGNRRFFGVDKANFVGCRGGTPAIPLLVVSHILSHCSGPVADPGHPRMAWLQS